MNNICKSKNKNHKKTQFFLNCLVEMDKIYTMSQRNCAKIVFLSELCQIYTNFDNFWQKHGKDAKIMQDTLILHLN